MYSFGDKILGGIDIWDCPACPCTPPPCPSSCCDCCHKYVVSFPLVSFGCCSPVIMGGSCHISATFPAHSETMIYDIYGDFCAWGAEDGRCHPDVSYTWRHYASTDCSGPYDDTGSNVTPVCDALIRCIGGSWITSLGSQFVTPYGFVIPDYIVEGKIIAMNWCPNGSYSNDISVTPGSPCVPNCCPSDCASCYTNYTVTISDSTYPDCDGTYVFTRSGCAWVNGTSSIGCDDATKHWFVVMSSPCSQTYDIGLGSGHCPSTGTVIIGSATLIITGA